MSFALINLDLQAQTICRDTNCLEFKNAKLGVLPDGYTNFRIIRKQPIDTNRNYRVKVKFGAPEETAADRLKASYIINTKKYDTLYERNDYKDYQIQAIEFSNEKSTVFYRFNDIGTLMSIQYISYSKGVFRTLKSGWPLISFYKNGEIREINYNNDKMERVSCQKFFPNGKIMYKANYKNSLFEGIIANYYPNGKIEKIATTSNDKINGYLLEFMESGKLDRALYYEKGVLTNLDTNAHKAQYFTLKLLADEEIKNIENYSILESQKLSLNNAEIQKKIDAITIKELDEHKKIQEKEIELKLKENILLEKEKKEQLKKNKLLLDIQFLNESALEQSKQNLELEQKNKFLLKSQKEKDSLEFLKRNSLLDEINKSKENKIKTTKELLEKEKYFKNIQTLFLSIVGFILIIALYFLYSNIRSKKRIRAQKIEVENQKKQIEDQKLLVDIKNHEILDSITYAKRLQEAILPSENVIKSFLPNTFIYYQPKDIVAGDFYYFESTADYIIFAAADCTGHGVPGAMVSVVCSNALNRSILEFNLVEPDQILNKTRELVVATFEKSGKDVKDGMDISILSIQKQTRKIKWAGANNPLWHLTNENIVEIKADKQPIGKSYIQTPFNSHEINVASNEWLFLFTDGYADQFGGQKGKKFKYKNMQELLLKLKNETPKDLQAKIENSFEEWKGDLEQVDDVCLIGIKF